MAQERTVIVNNHKTSPVIHDLLRVAHACIAIPGGILVGWLLSPPLGWDAAEGIFKGAIAGMLLVLLVVFGQILPRLSYLKYALYPLALLVTFLMRFIDPPRPYAAPAVQLMPPPVRPQVTGMRIVPGVGVQYDRSDDWGNQYADDDEEDDEPPADHVIVDTQMDEDMMTLARRFRQGKSAWSRKTMMTEGWTRSQWDAATRKLVECGVLLPDKSAPMAGYGQVIGE